MGQKKNLLPSAVHLVERLTVNQSVSWADQQSVRQSVGQVGRLIETHNSIAFGKSTSQRIYREQHTPKIGWKLHKYRLKHALHTLDDHFR